MTLFLESELQDVEVWIKIVKKEKVKGALYKFFNRVGLPFTWKLTTDEWLEILNFKKKQLKEEIKFNKRNNKYLEIKKELAR